MKKNNGWIALVLAGCMLMNPCFAYAQNIQEVDQDGDHATTMVSALKSSTYSVVLPKKITLTPDEEGVYNANYEVRLSEADFSGDDAVIIESDDFWISNGKRDYTIENDLNSQTDEIEHRISLSDISTIYQGSLMSEEALTAGGYEGTMSFTISLETDDAVEEQPEVMQLAPGLYDENNELLASLSVQQVEQGGRMEIVSIYPANYNYISIADLVEVDRERIHTVIIPNGTNSIGQYAFYNFTNLSKVVFPDSLTMIDMNAFAYCQSLASVKLPKNITTVGSGAFAFCSALTSMNFPSSVTGLGTSLFKDCTSLTTVSLPRTITQLPMMIFSGCSSLTDISIPTSVTKISSSAFEDCNALSDLKVPTNVFTIEENAFKNVPHVTYNGRATGSPWGALAIN